MRIKITGCDNSEKAWYADIAIVGCIFEVTDERSEHYIVDVGGVRDAFYVSKANCEIVEEHLSPSINAPCFKTGDIARVLNKLDALRKEVSYFNKELK